MDVLHLGFNNAVVKARVVAVVASGANPVRRLVEQGRKENKVIDATSGRKTRSIIVTDSGFFILSALHPETMLERISDEEK